MSLRRAALSLVALSSALAAQSTWIVDPSGAGNFTNLAAAQTAAAPGDTLILVGTVWAVSLTKTLHLVLTPGAHVSSSMTVSASGPLSISGGTFEDLVLLGTT